VAMDWPVHCRRAASPWRPEERDRASVELTAHRCLDATARAARGRRAFNRSQHDARATRVVADDPMPQLVSDRRRRRATSTTHRRSAPRLPTGIEGGTRQAEGSISDDLVPDRVRLVSARSASGRPTPSRHRLQMAEATTAGT
jgi:hypothetical protein